jgi:hypothetical protein
MSLVFRGALIVGSALALGCGSDPNLLDAGRDPSRDAGVEDGGPGGPADDGGAAFDGASSDAAPADAGDRGDAGASDDCAARPGPSGLSWATYPSINHDDRTADPTVFADNFGAPWPGNGNSNNIRIPRGHYAAMRFTTNSHGPDASARLQAANFPQDPRVDVGTETLLLSISKCPGDFRPFVLDAEMGPGCVQSSRFGIITLGGHGRANVEDPDVCALEPDTTYYMSFLFTREDVPQTEAEHDALVGTCSSDYCGDALEWIADGF